MKIFVTGGAGFIGSNFVRHLLREKPDWKVVNYDALTYAGNLENLQDVEEDPRYTFIKGDIADRKTVVEVLRSETCDRIINFAAESHVDRSILDPGPFLKTNVEGTQSLLEAARDVGVERFIQVGTDEAYGSLGEEGYFVEDSPLRPSSPYSASKTAADLIALAYHKTYQLPVVVTRGTNNYGPYQFPEKLIPLAIANVMRDEPVPIYGDGLYRRDWIHVEDHCQGLLAVLEKGEVGEVYNIGADCEKTNLDVIRTILKTLGKPESLMRHVEDRPGHDRRYATQATKLKRELGFEPKWSFDRGISETIRWYQEHRSWWERIIQGDYRRYYDDQYKGRLEGGGARREGDAG
ncbi:MAG: dTDP-glucose 4,6-dehydratase [Planctomycetota bacterium]|nr:dTDP-glucose 4,6-dehydratase [Planctomycetota bacterium]